MSAPDATLTNGRYELPPHARGVLVLADPPEAGWRLQASANEPASADRNPFASRELPALRQDQSTHRPL